MFVLNIEKSTLDLEKGGKRAVIGEIRTWDGVKYQKTANGWDKMKDNKVESKQEDNKQFFSKEYDEEQDKKLEELNKEEKKERDNSFKAMKLINKADDLMKEEKI